MDAHSKHLPADERRAVTIDAVIELSAEQNPGEITTAAIAKRMNLTQGALFRHFPTKDAIWQAVIDWVSERLLSRVDVVARRAKSPLEALEAVFAAHVDFVVEHPGVPRMLFGELQRAESTPAKQAARALMNRYRARVQALVEGGQAQGEISAEVDAAAAATLFIGTIQGLVMQSLLAGNVKRMRTEAPRAFAIYRRGIARRER